MIRFRICSLLRDNPDSPTHLPWKPRSGDRNDAGAKSSVNPRRSTAEKDAGSRLSTLRSQFHAVPQLLAHKAAIALSGYRCRARSGVALRRALITLQADVGYAACGHRAGPRGTQNLGSGQDVEVPSTRSRPANFGKSQEARKQTTTWDSKSSTARSSIYTCGMKSYVLLSMWVNKQQFELYGVNWCPVFLFKPT